MLDCKMSLIGTLVRNKEEANGVGRIMSEGLKKQQYKKKYARPLEMI